MGIFNIFGNQLSKVIRWDNADSTMLRYKYPSKRDEIINASKLIVAPGQGCILVYEGQIADVIETEGSFNLETDNHPFITTLTKLRQNFESEHKLDIYFFRRAQIINQHWGTPSPIKFIDSTYNIPVEIGLNGNFSYRIAEPRHFFTQIIGTRTELYTNEMSAVITERILQLVANVINEKRYSYTEIDAKLDDIAHDIAAKTNNEYTEMGLCLTDFRIVGTQFDEQTQERIGRVADISADIKAAEQAGLSYTELEKLRALRDAARNEGGLAGTGLQLGVGMELGRKFNEQTDNFISAGNSDAAEKLRKLKILLDEEIISQADFDTKKQEILSKM